MMKSKPKHPKYRAARDAYAAGKSSIAGIAARLGISPKTISAWRVKYEWPDRKPVPAKRPARRGSGNGRPRKGRLVRIWLIIDQMILRLEKAMTDDKGMTPSDAERLSRAVGTLVRNIAQAAEIEENVRQRKPQSSGPAGDDPERLRQALAERLERLAGRTGSPGGGPAGD
jgi:uncharacterized protein YjcR